MVFNCCISYIKSNFYSSSYAIIYVGFSDYNISFRSYSYPWGLPIILLPPTLEDYNEEGLDEPPFEWKWGLLKTFILYKKTKNKSEFESDFANFFIIKKYLITLQKINEVFLLMSNWI